MQRFSTEWHANTFAGSIVRKISRGMWAMDLLNDTLLIALLPSVVVLLGSTVLLGLRWPAMGASWPSAPRCIWPFGRRHAGLCRADRAAIEPLGHADRRSPGRCDRLQRGGEGVRRRSA